MLNFCCRQNQKPKTEPAPDNPPPAQIPPNDPNVAGGPTILVPQHQNQAEFHLQNEPDFKFLQMLGGGSGGQVYR
jgi:hypothetical protein